MRAIRRPLLSRGRPRTARDRVSRDDAQTWSEHCVHKTLVDDPLRGARRAASSARVGGWPRPAADGRPGHEAAGDGIDRHPQPAQVHGTAATHGFMGGGPDGGIDWCLGLWTTPVSSPRRSARRLLKCETHNHPSAIEPSTALPRLARRLHPRHHGTVRREADRIDRRLSASPSPAIQRRLGMRPVPAGCPGSTADPASGRRWRATTAIALASPRSTRAVWF